MGILGSEHGVVDDEEAQGGTGCWDGEIIKGAEHSRTAVTVKDSHTEPETLSLENEEGQMKCRRQT